MPTKDNGVRKVSKKQLHLALKSSMSQKPIHRILIILSAVAFMGSTVLGAVGLFSSALQEPKDDAKTAAAKSIDSQLQTQERGYELVLKREPGNQVALEALVQIRLQKNDLKGAIPPLEKLVKLNPDRASYKSLLAELKQRTGKAGKTGDR